MLIIKRGVYIERLKAERLKKGYSMAEMSKKMGYKSPSSWMYIEQGITRMNPEKMKLVSLILEKNVEYFFDLNVQDNCT